MTGSAGRCNPPASRPPNRLTWLLSRSSAAALAWRSSSSQAWKDLRPVRVQAIEGTGLDQRFELPLVEGFGIDPPGEIEQVLEATIGLALAHDRLHRLRPDAFHGGKGVADRGAGFGLLDGELDPGAVDVGRQQLDLEAVELLAEDVELVGIAEIEGHRRGKELDRIVRLEIGGLEGDQRIGRGVALVEAVAGEFRHLIEDMIGDALADAALRRAIDERLALRVHLGLDLLAHGTAQQIGAAERIARQHLRDLHDLLLVDHDPVRLLEDALERRVQVVGLLAAVLHRDIARDVLHRARPIERDDGDDVLEAVGQQLAQHVAHALTFELEHADRIAVAQQLVALGIVERQIGEVELDAAPTAASRPPAPARSGS